MGNEAFEKWWNGLKILPVNEFDQLMVKTHCRAAFAAGQAAEREECAKVAENFESNGSVCSDVGNDDPEIIAKLIRARATDAGK